LIILLVFLQYRLWNGNGSLPHLWQLEEIKTQSNAGNEELLERNLALGAEVMDLKDGVEAIEERARIEMGMIQSGELFYQIIEKPDSSLHRGSN
ncbi:MAG: septum formation initiator family protein, partial [Gammaproteobacteria bacterium]